MKTFKTLVRKLPKSTVVFAFGRFNPYTSGHDLLTNKVKSIAASLEADHVIVLSKSQDSDKNPLSVEKRLYWAKKISKGTNFIPATDELPSFMHFVGRLNRKYKNIIMVAGSDRVAEYEDRLNKYNGKSYQYDSIKVVSVGDRDPDSESISGISGTKMREFARKSDFESFKKCIPKSLSLFDAKRYFSDVQNGLGITSIQEQIKLEIAPEREAFYQGKLYKVDDIVEDDKGIYEVLDIGSNYLTVITEDGVISKKWPDKVKISKSEYHPKYFNIESLPVEVQESFRKTNESYINGEFKDKLALVSSFININKYFVTFNKECVEKAYSLLENINQIENHSYIKELIEMSANSSDKQKIAVIIANTFGEAVRGMSPEELVNDALTRAKTIKLTSKSRKAFHNMLKIAKDAGINYDQSLVEEESEEHWSQHIGHNEYRVMSNGKTVKTFKGETAKEDADKHVSELKNHKKINEAEEHSHEHVMKKINDGHWEAKDDVKVGKHVQIVDLTKKDKPTKHVYIKEADSLNDFTIDDGEQSLEDTLSDEDLESIINTHLDFEEDYLDAYDDEELSIIDADTGEEVACCSQEDEELSEEAVQKLNEVLTRPERIRAKIRFARTKAKRERRLELALKRKGDNKTINKRARRLAVKALKRRLAKKPLDKLSVAEKERLEQRLSKSKAILNRLSVKLIPRVKQLEKDRLNHKSFTKEQ